jgi:hypothetical protein
VQFTQRGADVAGELERDQQEFARVLFEGMPAAQLTGFVRGLDAVLDRLRTSCSSCGSTGACSTG